jgi:zinc-binding alcohol dehydrogenase family protein
VEIDMKAVAYKRSLPISDSDSLLDVEIAKPVANGHDMLVKVKAISVNPVDTKIRTRIQPEPGQYKILGWDAVGIVDSTGKDVTLFSPGDEVWYAGAIDRQGSNAEYQLVDERIVGHKPAMLDNAKAAALPLTSITAWELLFDRLSIRKSTGKSNDTLLIIGAAGGVGSILTQLASQLTGVTVIATASRADSRQWVKKLGADHVIDHSKPLHEELKNIGIETVSHVASLTHSDQHFDQVIEVLAPFGKLAMIDDPGLLDFTKLKTKSISLHWEFMYTRSLFQTPDMIEQHHLLSEVATLIDNKILTTTFAQHLGKINADNLKRAHALIESGKSIGKIVLEDF